MNSKKSTVAAAIMIFIACACVIAYVPAIKLLSRIITTPRPLFSNERYSKEGFRHWEIPHIEKDKHGWGVLVDGNRNVIVLFEPSKRSDLEYTYSIQPPRAGERVLRIWLNKEFAHEILVHDETFYLIRGESQLNVAAPTGLGNLLLAAKGGTDDLEFSVEKFLASRDDWSNLAAIVNPETSSVEKVAIPVSDPDGS